MRASKKSAFTALLLILGIMLFFNGWFAHTKKYIPIKKTSVDDEQPNIKTTTVSTTLVATTPAPILSKWNLISQQDQLDHRTFNINGTLIRYPPILKETMAKDINLLRTFTPNRKFVFNKTDTLLQRDLNRNVTLVTAFINIGSFKKLFIDQIHSPLLYRTWMQRWEYINNPVVAYLESDEDMAYFNYIRQRRKGHQTSIIKFKRENSWIFSQKDRINRTLQDRGYEVLSDAVDKNPFRTKYFAWADIGIFREIYSKKDYVIDLPYKFEEDKIAIGEVTAFQWQNEASRKAIFYQGIEWLSGGMFLGTREKMETHAKGYIDNVKNCLSDNYIGADQQMLYDLINRKKHLVDFKIYRVKAINAWFAFMYYCRRFLSDAENKNAAKSINNL